jgi:hypothetical protein
VRLSRALVLAASIAFLVAGLVWALFFWLPGKYARPKSAPAQIATASAPVVGRKIKARLFYVSEGGTKLTGMELDVPYGEGTVEQARAIVNAQIAPPVAPLVSAIPAGTSLRALFVTDRGEAFVDFSPEFAAAHPGGSVGELLTVDTIVNALTVNLPVIKAVQLLVDGKEVDSLAGHVDLGRPLSQNLSLVE